MKDFFHGIQTLFVDYLFWPYDALRHLQLSSWVFSNIISWLLLFTGIAAFTYWMIKLKEYDEDTAHSHDYDHHINVHVTSPEDHH
ncbi:MAG: uracil phosphoribosyltransferase [Aquaticitalea sp.]